MAIYFLLLAAALAAVLIFMGPAAQFRGDAALGQINAGRTVYGAHCAVCHGKNLEGQPNWQTPLPSGKLPAPPQDESGHSWHHSDEVLIGITKQGILPFAPEGYQSDMPAFVNVLSNTETEAVLAYIKSTWPKREREYQERITRQQQQ